MPGVPFLLVILRAVSEAGRLLPIELWRINETIESALFCATSVVASHHWSKASRLSPGLPTGA